MCAAAIVVLVVVVVVGGAVETNDDLLVRLVRKVPHVDGRVVLGDEDHPRSRRTPPPVRHIARRHRRLVNRLL